MRIVGAFLLILLLAVPCFAIAPGQTDYVLFSDAASARAHSIHLSGMHIERCGGMVGLRNESYLCLRAPARISEDRNLALNPRQEGYPRPNSSSTDTVYSVWGPIDGINEGGEYTWTNQSSDGDHSTWELDFGKPIHVAKIVVKTRESYALKDFDLLRWDERDNDWNSAHPIARVRGNHRGAVVLDGLDLTTRKLRALCLSGPDHQAIFRRISEFEVYGPKVGPLKAKPYGLDCRMRIPTAGEWTLEVQEVNDDRSNGDRTRYRILADGKPVHLHDYADIGPGLYTYFVDLPATGKSFANIRFEDISGYGMRIRSLRAYSRFEDYCRQNRYMLPMVICPRLYLFKNQTELSTDLLDQWMRVFEEAGALDRLGIVNIMSYAQRSPETIERQTEALCSLALEWRIPMIFQYTSTWADTPMRTPDGAGGHFGDIQYQQIGYSKYDNYDDPGLREYMDLCKPGWYDIHYGLTTPNHWSSTPWLTMNNDRLNGFRQKRLTESINQLNPWISKFEMQGLSDKILGFITDDEPIYWTKLVDLFDDGYSRVNNGQKRRDLMLDFNWGAVQDAAREGVILDPRDGLDQREKQWLQNNITRYNRLMMRTISQALPKPAIMVTGNKLSYPTDDIRRNLYVYAYDTPGYPLNDQYHRLWETGIFEEAAVGIETSSPESFPRARELGRIANSDFECGGSTPERVANWLDEVRGFYEGGARYIHFCNPGDAQNWRAVAELIAHPSPEMDRERMESLLIAWRRDAEDLLARLDTSRGVDSHLLAEAHSLLREGHYRDAYEAALRAQALQLPACYSVKDSGWLRPYGIFVKTSNQPAQVIVYDIGRKLRLKAICDSPIRISLDGIPANLVVCCHPANQLKGSRLKVTSSGKLSLDIPAGSYIIEAEDSTSR